MAVRDRRSRAGELRPGHVMMVSVAVVLAYLAFAVGLHGASGGIGTVPSASAVDRASGAGPSGSTSSTDAERTDIVELASPDHPVAVGVRTATFTDTTRGTPARGNRAAMSTRPLQVTIRYPTAGSPGSSEIADAPALAPAPLVVFGHGFLQASSRYETVMHDLASSGFVVVAPEFPMSSMVFAGAGDALEVPEQAKDVAFLISSLNGPGAPAELAALIAPGSVGLLGQSDGAVTSLLAAYSPKYADARVGAVVAVSGDWNTFGGNWYTTQHPPVLAVHGEKDEVNPFYSSEWVVDHHPGSAMLVAVRGANHLGSVVDPENAHAVARLTALYFRWHLEAVPGAEEATRSQANTAPLRLVVDHG